MRRPADGRVSGFALGPLAGIERAGASAQPNNPASR